eukprot:Pgem_evm1s5931
MTNNFLIEPVNSMDESMFTSGIGAFANINSDSILGKPLEIQNLQRLHHQSNDSLDMLKNNNLTRAHSNSSETYQFEHMFKMMELNNS